MRRPHWNTTCPKRLSRSRLSRLLAVGIVILTGLGGGAWSLGAESRRATANWPAWRRDGSGISDEKGLPTVWSETQNVLWRTGDRADTQYLSSTVDTLLSTIKHGKTDEVGQTIERDWSNIDTSGE